MPPPICDALRRTLEDSGLTQQAFAALVDEKQQTISAWLSRREPKLDDIARIEQALALPCGYLLRAAGYVVERTDVRSAINSDPNLTPAFRDIVLRTYDSGVEWSAKERKTSLKTPKARPS